MAANQDTVDTPSATWEKLYERWKLPLVLRKGTDGIRAEGETWLQREQAETPGQYQKRLARTFLHPAFDDTVEKIVAKPFSQAITFRGELPERLQPMLDDVDGEGNTLDQFAARTLEASVTTGMSHLLVDYPALEARPTLADERKLDLIPRFVHVPSERLFAWGWERLPNGALHLASIRFKESREVEVGTWGSEVREFIRVYTFREGGFGDATYQEFEQLKIGAQFTPVAGPSPITFDGVPLVTHYTNRTGAMEAVPPLQGIADLNLAHYQVSSEHRNVLNVVGVAMLFRTGVDGKAKDERTVISPRAVYSSSTPEARMEWVEHSGKGVEAIERYLEQTEKRMETLGSQPFSQRARLTATQRVMDESKTETTVQSWVRGLEETLTNAFRIAGEWIGETVSDDFAVQVFNDFAVGNQTEQDLRALGEARTRGDLDRLTYLSELQRRGTLSADLDVEEVAQAASDEPPDARSMMGGLGDVTEEITETGAAA